MQRHKRFGWLPNSLFQTANPIPAVIVGIEDTEDDTILRVSINQTVYQMSIWGDNLNTLIEKFGEEDSKWIGKQISISNVTDVSKDGKATNKKIIQ